MCLHPHTTSAFDREEWVIINDVAGKYKGEIYLEMTFFPSGPPPPGLRPSELLPQEKLQHLKHPRKTQTAGGKLVVVGAQAQEISALRINKPPRPIQQPQWPAPLPSILHPSTGHDQGSRPDGYTSPANPRPPLTLFTDGPPTMPLVQQSSSADNFGIPGPHSPPSPHSGYGSPYSPYLDHSPPRLAHPPLR